MPLPFLIYADEPATHALLVNHLKHHYLTNSGEVRYQKAKRDPDAKRGQSIRLYLLCDLWTGAAFGELQPFNQEINILGFLSRAWFSPKPWTCFAGLPDRLVVNTQLQNHPEIAWQLKCVGNGLELPIDPPLKFPPWYANTVRRFEDEISSVQWRWESHVTMASEGYEPARSLCLNELGTLTTISFTDRYRYLWRESESLRPGREMPEDWLDFVDRSHVPHAGWRDLLHLDWPEMKPLGERDHFQ